MPEVRNDDVVLHVEVDGTGEPVTVFAHGLTNSCRELAAFTPFTPGTAVRFDFRGHGRSSVPPAGSYGFDQLSGDLDAVARAYGATRAVGTSMGQGAISRLLATNPHRFERLVFVLPACFDVPMIDHSRFDRVAELLETLPKDDAIESILDEAGRAAVYERATWLRELELFLWQDMNPLGVARAIREVVRDVAIPDRELFRKVDAPTLVICREGDPIHPAELGAALAELMPNAELIMLPGERELYEAIPQLVGRVSAFLAGDEA
jgi:pimeloyl-ACP methyl ester carboxylesterase